MELSILITVVVIVSLASFLQKVYLYQYQWHLPASFWTENNYLRHFRLWSFQTFAPPLLEEGRFMVLVHDQVIKVSHYNNFMDCIMINSLFYFITMEEEDSSYLMGNRNWSLSSLDFEMQINYNQKRNHLHSKEVAEAFFKAPLLPQRRDHFYQLISFAK